MSRKTDRELILGNLVSALNMIQKVRDFTLIVPEIRISLAYAVPWAKTIRDVAAIEGRIAVISGYPRAVGLPAFGASIHMASLILELRKYDTDISAAINFKCNKEIIEILKQYAAEGKLKFSLIDRNMEPPEPQYKELGSAHWRVKYMVDTSGGVPRIFYENEGMGKEPLSIIVGKDAIQVTKMTLEIAKRYRNNQKVRPKRF